MRPRAAFGAVRSQAGGGTPSSKIATPLASGGKLRHSSFSLTSLCALSTPLVLGTFEITHMRSLVITSAHSIMFQVLTGMCSSRVHRIWSGLAISSSERFGTQQKAALHRTGAVGAARDGGRSMRAMELAVRAYTLVHRGGHMAMDGRLGVRVVFHVGHDSRLPACARCTERLCHGCGRLGQCADAQGRL